MERITVLAGLEFKAFWAGEAEGVSISELVRQRCERQLGKDEALLGTLAEQLRLSNAAANAALDRSLAALDKAQAEMKRMQAERKEMEATAA